jgi:hypothetical protein
MMGEQGSSDRLNAVQAGVDQKNEDRFRKNQSFVGLVGRSTTAAAVVTCGTEKSRPLPRIAGMVED